MNHSIYSVDRRTHLKIIVIALSAAVTMASVAISSRINANSGVIAVLKGGKPVAIIGSTLALTR